MGIKFFGMPLLLLASRNILVTPCIGNRWLMGGKHVDTTNKKEVISITFEKSEKDRKDSTILKIGTSDGEEENIMLFEAPGIMDPNMKMEVGSNDCQQEDISESNDCIYEGKVDGEPNSVVIVFGCDEDDVDVIIASNKTGRASYRKTKDGKILTLGIGDVDTGDDIITENQVFGYYYMDPLPQDQRQKRKYSNKTLEVGVVVDPVYYNLVKSTKEIEKQITLLLGNAGSFLGHHSISKNGGFRVFVSETMILKNYEAKGAMPMKGKNRWDVLKPFTKYAEEWNKDNRFDVVILLKGKEVGNILSGYKYNGRAKINTVCTRVAAAVAEVPISKIYKRKVILTDGRLIAHEIGHVLGAEHDGVFDSLQIGGKLEEGRWLKSENGKCYVVMQSDGNFVLYRSHDKTAFWETGTTQPGIRPVLYLQDDGNLVIYYQDGAWSMVAWSSGTGGNDGKNVKLKLQNDGNLVLYDDSIALWSTGPNQQACSGPEGHNNCEPYKYLMHTSVDVQNSWSTCSQEAIDGKNKDGNKKDCYYN